ncbi:hypothetical protein CYY_009349 [Polysphondylium violaceum]|uniref:Uncharacterized protein n=1 Tax=Polysphondylium violaceum TaxID=133409 RepID=A0A8J4PND8_9MYCE|nr:hypothetical protein CYY_009349 [Polysphondylium violaceum]
MNFKVTPTSFIYHGNSFSYYPLTFNFFTGLLRDDEEPSTLTTPIQLVAKGGHRIEMDGAKATTAKVMVNLPTTTQYHSWIRLPLKISPAIDVKKLEISTHVYQQNRVKVCFPQLDPKGIGYVHIEEYGLNGGAGGIGMDTEKLITDIVSGFNLVGMRPSTEMIQSWRPFISDFSTTLSNMTLDLKDTPSPMSVDSYDPGNYRSTFERIASQATNRRITLTRYGVAYLYIVGQIRSKIKQQQSLSIDPVEYPSHSYSVSLQPNLLQMLPLVATLNHLYATPIGGEFTFDIGSLAQIANVNLRFHPAFLDFENSKRTTTTGINLDDLLNEALQETNLKEADRKQANQQTQEKIRKTLSEVSNSLDHIECVIEDAKNQWHSLNSSTANYIVSMQEIIKSLKEKHTLLTQKLTILDDLAGADELIRAKRKECVGQATKMQDELDILLPKMQQEMEKVKRDAVRQESTLFVNPTGKGIRNDSGGQGHFRAPRGTTTHEGIDFSTIVGQDIVAPFDGYAMNRIGAKSGYPLVDIYPTKPYSEFDYLQILYVVKPETISSGVSRLVKAGGVVGVAANLQTLNYPPTVGPHVHVQLLKGDKKIDPTPFFFKG